MHSGFVRQEVICMLSPRKNTVQRVQVNTAIYPEKVNGYPANVSATRKLINLSRNKMTMSKLDNLSHRSALSVQGEEGFTLLELLVVMVIIGLLAGYVAPKYFNQIGKSEIKLARAQIDSLGKALDTFRLDTGHYPSMEEGLATLVSRPQNDPKWDGPYLKKGVPQDPWDHPYVYKIPGEHGDYDLLSYGKDGQPGGEGEAADVTSW
jgi:general secretion pathway protein G